MPLPAFLRSSSLSLETAPFVLLLGLAIVGLATGLVVQARQRRVLGALVSFQQAPRRFAQVATVVLVAALGFRLTGDLNFPQAGLEVAAAVAALACLWLLPAEGDRGFYANGVRVGTAVRTFAVLEEWRLTGEHLRFRLHGEWTAVHVPPERHPDLRALLVAQAPGRESRFTT